MNYKMRNIFLLFVVMITSCAPPAHMHRRGGLFYEEKREKTAKTAERYIGIKYRHGGDTLFGFDCSGFVLFVYAKNGLEIPRSSADQYNAGTKIPLNEAKPGDLVFFRLSGKNISHVGIYAGNNRFIHSPSKGKKISYAEIDNPYWKKRYAGAVTYF